MATRQNPPFPPPTVMAFVDAGYLTAGARAHLKLPSTPRIDSYALSRWAWRVSHGDLLRTYIYDAQFPDDVAEYPDQRAYFDVVGAQPDIRLRLGHLIERAAGSTRAKWQQKGVDTLLVLDLVRLAQLRAFDTAVIIAGDRDLAEAIRVVADDHARRVILYSVEGSAPARELVQAADRHGVIGGIPLRLLVGQLLAGGDDATSTDTDRERPAGDQQGTAGDREAPRQP
jgi:hypothetical protein